jgi:Ca2+-binding RTX toxin-like protein
MTGPGNSGNFCAPVDGSGTDRQAPEQGDHLADGDETDEGYHDNGGTRTLHTESETTGNGRFVFGIESETAGDTQLLAWLDSNGNDVQDGGEVSDVSIMHWEGEPSACDITGTDGPDVLEGSDAGERICGFGGDDTILGGGGDDVILGGAGDDVLRGNAGNDQVTGGAGGDRVFGGGGADSLFGSGGPDVVKGHRSNDRLRGNRGNDRLGGGGGRDDCAGGAGRDRLRKCETGTRSFAARTRPI